MVQSEEKIYKMIGSNMNDSYILERLDKPTSKVERTITPYLTCGKYSKDPVCSFCTWDYESQKCLYLMDDFCEIYVEV